MKTKFLILCIVVILILPHIQVVSAQSDEWLSIENDFFTVEYQAGDEDEANITLDTAMMVRNITLEKYPHELNFKVVIRIYSDREDYGGHIAVADVNSSSATISIMRPSWESTWGGYETLGEPFRRLLNHEYVHVPFYVDLYSKSTGYANTPAWFSQGLAEYISQNYLHSYTATVQQSVQNSNFTVDEQPYSWGIYIVEFMYTEYGQKKVVDLIKSNAPTFEQAITDELGLMPSQFENSWKLYLADKFDAEYVPIVDLSYEEMLADYEALQSDYQTLQANYDSLQSDYNTLHTMYNELNATINNLDAQEATPNENGEENLVTYFFVATILLITIVAHIVIRKKLKS